MASTIIDELTQRYKLLKKHLPSDEFPTYWVEAVDMFGEPSHTEVFQVDEKNGKARLSEGYGKYSEYALEDEALAALIEDKIRKLRD
ncbi:hypothetical protein N9T47_01190 [Luminiphilus sp.]|nr:hypothetical protein [Luminiphilus sp.]MDA9666766.1 hypothetical protein [Luminiphilus sp.]